jgi:hypothetical protein
MLKHAFNNNNNKQHSPREVFVDSKGLQIAQKGNIWLQCIAVIFPAGVIAANRELDAFDVGQQL